MVHAHIDKPFEDEAGGSEGQVDAEVTVSAMRNAQK